MKKSISYVLVIFFIILFPISSFAHSGRTDSNGGHKDNKNKSGLGYYHYHCGGNPPHLHTNGVCPYSSNSNKAQLQSSPSISLKKYPKTLNVGENAKVEFSVVNSYYTNASISSSNSDIVKVNSDGSLTGINVGVAEITISTFETKKTFTVEIKAIPVETINFTNMIDKLQLGDTYQFNVSISPENATYKDISWESDNPNILEVNNEGVIKANSVGTATIVCSSVNNIKSKLTIEVYEVFPESIECEDSIELIVGNNYNFNYNILPDIANNKTLILESEDEELLKCSDLTLHAIKEGETMLYIRTFNNIKKDIPVKINITPVEKVSIKDSTKYIFPHVIDKSGEISISAEITPDDATYKDVAWSSSNNDIVTISDNEFIIKGTGKVVLTCTTHEDISNKIEIFIIDNNTLLMVITITAYLIVIIIIIVKFLKSRK